MITAELDRLHQSNFQSLTKAGVNWYDIVKNSPKLLEKYLNYLKLKSEYIMVNIDFSQLELYALASLSGDQDMIATVNSGRDLHDVNTEKVYGISKSEREAAHKIAEARFKENPTEDNKSLVQSAQMLLDDFKAKRKFIKALSFSLTYGAGANKIARDLKITMAEALKLINDFYNTYPKTKEWQEKTFLFAIRNGYIETPFGRQRGTPRVYNRMDAYDALILEKPSAISKLKKAGEYWSLREELKVCKNTPVQSTATDMCSMSFCIIRKEFRKNLLRRANPFFWVHDADMFSTHIDTAVDNIKYVIDVMENQVKYKGDPVNYRAEAEVGYNYEYVAGIKRAEIYSDAFTKEFILKKLEESLTADLEKKFKLVIKSTGTSMDKLKDYVETQKEAKGDYFNQLVENLGLGVSTPDEYMSMMNGMSLTDYIDSEETKLGDDEEEDD